MILDVRRGGLVLRLRPQAETLGHLAFSPDGLRMATCSQDGSIVISDTRLVRERCGAGDIAGPPPAHRQQ